MGESGGPPALYDHLFKILIVGDSGVGKSSILLRFTDDSFEDKQLSTIGVDVKFKYLKIRDKQIKLAIWDTAGQERFRTLTKSYYRGAQGVIVVYDCANRESFDSVRQWLDDISYHTQDSSVHMLVANKIDKGGREVSRSEGEEFACDHSALFIETSAKTREGIKDAFEELVLKILETPTLLGTTTPLGRADLRDEEGGRSESACC